jgi:hypothetical protein
MFLVFPIRYFPSPILSTRNFFSQVHLFAIEQTCLCKLTCVVVIVVVIESFRTGLLFSVIFSILLLLLLLIRFLVNVVVDLNFKEIFRQLKLASSFLFIFFFTNIEQYNIRLRKLLFLHQ